MNRPVAPPKKLLLIVDDVATNLHVLSSALRDDYAVAIGFPKNAALLRSLAFYVVTRRN